MLVRTKVWQNERLKFIDRPFREKVTTLSSDDGRNNCPGDEDMEFHGTIQIRDEGQEEAKKIESYAGILTVYEYVECELDSLCRVKGNLELCRGATLYAPKLRYVTHLFVDKRATLIAPELVSVKWFGVIDGGKVIAPKLPKSQRRR